MIHAPKNLAVYATLALIWALMVAWLAFEHKGVERLSQQALLNRARDTSDAIAMVSRSRRFGVIRQERLEETLSELTKSEELVSVALLNQSMDVVAHAGERLPLTLSDLPHAGVEWGEETVTVVNLVDFGTADADDGTTRPPTIVIPSRDEQTTESRTLFGSPPRSDERRRRDEAAMRAATEATTESERATAERRDRNAGDRNDGDDERRRGNRLRAFGRPPWLTQTQFEELQRKQGLHGFVLVLSSDAVRAETGRDLWLRVIIGAIALAAAIGAALAWRSMENSTRLQMRLLRAHEMNTHLQELNLAAAGLAHETRNPLNIVRGLAQMIARREDTPEEVRERSGQITEEVDRVTGRLNEFINYSRPPEPRPSATRLKTVVADVERALGSDFSDKGLQFEWVGPDLTVEADESLLRQVLFNMLLNAVQAVPDGGLVRVSVANGNHGEASLAVEDNGPGVPDEFREEIFRPYFTTNSHGTGLGLAVVNQIVLAHRWEIGYVRNEMGGASFRVSGLKTV